VLWLILVAGFAACINVVVRPSLASWAGNLAGSVGAAAFVGMFALAAATQAPTGECTYSAAPYSHWGGKLGLVAIFCAALGLLAAGTGRGNGRTKVMAWIAGIASALAILLALSLSSCAFST
jgi:hypothetical protein